MDIYRPLTPISQLGYKYIIFFLDTATRFLDFKLPKQKSEAFIAFKHFKSKVENQSSKKN
jgi:hypothetical protein